MSARICACLSACADKLVQTGLHKCIAEGEQHFDISAFDLVVETQPEAENRGKSTCFVPCVPAFKNCDYVRDRLFLRNLSRTESREAGIYWFLTFG